MEEKKFVHFKKQELGVKEYIKQNLRRGQVSGVKIEYTPVGEKIVIATNKPGLVIGRGGERINELTNYLKRHFKLENPHIEILEIINSDLDAQLVADNIAQKLESMGPLKFKVIAYSTLQRIMAAGAQGAEIRLGGKLPSDRAKSWRFSAGYLKKTGDTSKLVNKAMSIAQTKPGTVGIKVSILAPNIEMPDRITVDEKFINKIKENKLKIEESEKKKTKKSKKTKEDSE
jgi:small subunit ribosomal protein S3